MWTILIITIAAIIIWAIYSNNNENEIIREYYNNVGGLRTNYPIFVNILENEFGMILKYDDGRKFCYKKVDGSGELNIGLKLDYNNVKIIFSELIKDGNIQKGNNITFSSDNDNVLFLKSIKKSIENLKTSNSFEISPKKHLKEWEEFVSKSKNEDFIIEHVNNLYIFDDIDPKKFIANLYYKKERFDRYVNEHTKSMNEILYVPPLFTDLFIVSYPDVYLWVQKNHSRIEVYNNVEIESEDYLKNIENLIPLYRKMINQYKKEGNKLECK